MARVRECTWGRHWRQTESWRVRSCWEEVHGCYKKRRKEFDILVTFYYHFSSTFKVCVSLLCFHCVPTTFETQMDQTSWYRVWHLHSLSPPKEEETTGRSWRAVVLSTGLSWWFSFLPVHCILTFLHESSVTVLSVNQLLMSSSLTTTVGDGNPFYLIQ